MNDLVAILFEFGENVGICSDADRRGLRENSGFRNVIVYFLRSNIDLIGVIRISERNFQGCDRYIVFFNQFGRKIAGTVSADSDFRHILPP